MRTPLRLARRSPPDDSWTWVKGAAEAIAFLETRRVERLSLDHDLGIFEDGRELTGNDVVLWLEEAVAVHGVHPPTSIAVDSANPPAREKMQRGIDFDRPACRAERARLVSLRSLCS